MVVGIVFCALALPFLWFGAIFLTRRLRMRGRAEGEVLSLREEQSEDGESTWATVRFRLPDGRDVESETATSLDADLPVGRRVSVRYVPGDPSRMDVAGALNVSIKVTFGAGAVLLAIGGGIILASTEVVDPLLLFGLLFTVLGTVFLWGALALKRSDARQLAATTPVQATIRSIRHDDEGFGTPTVTYQALDGDFVTREIDYIVSPDDGEEVGATLDLRLTRGGQIATEEIAGAAGIGVMLFFGATFGLIGLIVIAGTFAV